MSSKNKLKNIILCFSVVFFLSLTTKAQIMPVGVNVIINPPSSPYIADYYSLESTAFQAFVTLNDLNEPSWDVRLIVRIEGQGIVIETKKSFIPNVPVNLISGVPQLIEGTDLAPYLDINNLNLQGISAATLQNGKLPEGIYQFCIQVLDYQTGTPLSFDACGPAFIFLENPPILLVPSCEVSIQPTNPQNVYFHWQLAGGASPTIAATSKFKLFVYELQDESENPYFAVQNNKALLIFESEYQQSTSQTIDFGMSNSAPLVPGKIYIYRVRALDADEKNIYQNDGYSEYCWFYYGYPQDGIINLTAPADAHIFTKLENKMFAWETSDKGVPGQEFSYVLVIKEKNTGQTNIQAMDQNPEWLSVNLPTTTSFNGGDYLLSQELDYGKNYVWQIKANTGTQLVAKSPVHEFFSPSVMDQFLAGNFPVKILTMTSFVKNGNTYNNLTGRGRIQLSDDPNDFVDADFSGITVEDYSGTMLMTNGSFSIDLSSRSPKELQSSLPENGTANFYYSSALIDKNGLKINGRIEWPFPHATNATELQVVKSKNTDFVLNSQFLLNGSVTIDATKNYSLLEPNELVISLDSTTQINVFSDKFSMKFNGSILTNSGVKTNNASPYSIKINQQAQLYYFNANNLLISSTNYLSPITGLNLGLMPKSAIIDLSEDVSPDKLASDPAWKGIYFPQFQVRMFNSQFDNTNQVVLPSNIDFHEDLTIHDFWISNQGLQFKYEFSSDETGILFNKFKTAVQGKIKITDNIVSESYIRGSIKIPVINEQDLFSFEIPINTDGLQLGYLNEDLSLRDIVFNPFGGENRVNVTINRAVFADNERLDLEINAEMVGFNANVNNVNDFRVYGDNVIGIGSRNGSKKLDTRAVGTYKGFGAFITDIGAALYNGNYVFSYIAEMDLGEDVSGEDGPPLLSVSSVSPVGSGVELPSYSISSPQPEPAIDVPSDPDVASSQTITSVEMFIGINNSVVEINGYLTLKANDPVWGSSFSGGINGKIKVPTEIQAGANMILGNRDGLKFWYFDAWFNDTQGTGIPVGNLFNITAMEGRIYHHMSKAEDQFIIDPAMAFGGALYMQIIDPTGGRTFAADIGAELKVFEDGEFTLSMKGEVSVLNKNVRTPGGGLTAAVGEAIVEEIIESVGPLSLSLEINGGTLTVEAENLKAGSLQYSKSEYTFGVSADVSSKPSLGFNFAKGTTNFNINADAAGEFALGVGFDGNQVGLGLSGTNGGYLDFSISGAVLQADINRSNRTGNFLFGYDGKEVGIGVTPNSGSFNLKLSPTLAFNAGYNTAGSANIGFQYDNNSFSLEGDKVAKTGRLAMTLGELELDLSANATDKSAALLFNYPGIGIDISGQKDVGGAFHLASNDFNIDIDCNLPSKSGSLGFEFDGGNKAFYAGLDGGSQGSLSFKNGSQEFGISGNADGSAGSVSYKDGTNEFSIAADRPAGTGSLVLNLGGNGISSSITPDSSYVNYIYNNYSFSAGASSAGTGGLTYADGTNSFGIYGNPSAKRGSFDLIYSGNHIALSTDIPNNEHSILVDAGDVLFDAKTSSESDELSVGYQNYLVKIARTQSASGSGGSAGSVSYTDGTNNISLNADPDAQSGSIIIDLGGNGINSSVNQDTAFANFNYEGYAFSTGVSSAGTGAVKFSSPGNSFELIGNPTLQKGSVDLTFGSNHIALSTDIPGQIHSIDIASSGVTFNAATSPSDKSIAASYNGYAVHAEKIADDYEVGLSQGGKIIEGGLQAGVPRIAYADENLEVSISTEKIILSSGGNIMNVTAEGITVNGSSVEEFLGSVNSSFTVLVGSVNTTVTLNSGVYSVLFASNGNSFQITTSDFSDGSLLLTVSGNNIGLTRNSGKYTLTVNDLEASYEPGIISLQKGTERKLMLNGDVLSLVYDGYNMSVSPSEFNYSDGQNSASISSEGLALAKDDKELFVGPEQFGLKLGTGKSLNLTESSIAVNYDEFAAAYTVGQKVSASYNVYSFDYESGKLTLKNGEARKLEISNSALGVTFDNYVFNASSSGFTYSDGTNSAAISDSGLSVAHGTNSLFIGQNSFGLNIGESKHVFLTSNSLDVKYDNYEASFSNSNSLSFTDGTRSFALSSSGLEMNDGDKHIAVIDQGGLPAIELSNGTDLFQLSQSGFAIEYGGKRYAVNDQEFLKVEIDNQRYIEVMNNGVKYVDGVSEFILGGDDNLVELKYSNFSMALSKDEKLVLQDGTYTASLSRDLEVEFSDGVRNISLFKESHYLTYEQDGYQFGIRGANGSVPGIDFSNGDYTFFVEGERNKDVTVGVTSAQFGTMTASVNSAMDIRTTLSTGPESIYGFAVKNGKLQLINGTDTEPEIEHLEGAPSIPAQDGPIHLTNSIADDAGGCIRGEATIYFDSRNSHFMMTAAVAGNNPICINGAMAMDVSPGQFNLDIGTETQRVEVYPTCSGFGGGGWLGIHNTNVNVGVFAGWRASASVSIGGDICGASLSAEAGAELGVRANLDLDPFKINNAGVWVDLYAGIYARYWAVGVSGSLTIAEVRLHGDLMLYFEEQTRIEGNLNGSICILDIISADFDMSFNTTI